jgi:hypothetical protein
MHIELVTKDLIESILSIVKNQTIPPRVRQAAITSLANFSSFHDAPKDVISSFGVEEYLTLLFDNDEVVINDITAIVPRILLSLAIYCMIHSLFSSPLFSRF